VGPSSSQPLTPSSKTPGDTAARANSMPHASSMPKSSMMYGTNGAGGLGSSSNQMVSYAILFLYMKNIKEMPWFYLREKTLHFIFLLFVAKIAIQFHVSEMDVYLLMAG